MHTVSQQRNVIVKYAFWGLVLLVVLVTCNIITAGDAAHIIAVVASGIWQFLQAAWSVLLQAIDNARNK